MMISLTSTLNKRIPRGWNGVLWNVAWRAQKIITSATGVSPLLPPYIEHCCTSSLTSPLNPEEVSQSIAERSGNLELRDSSDKLPSLEKSVPSPGDGANHAFATARAAIGPSEGPPRLSTTAKSQTSQKHQPRIYRWRKGSTAERVVESKVPLPLSRSVNVDVSVSAGLPRKPEEGKRFVREVKRLGDSGNWRGALSLLRAAETDGRTVNSIMYNATIAALSRSARWQEAISILRSMKANGVERDVKGYSAAMVACREAGEWERALALLADMKEEGIAPNLPTFCVALSACSKRGQWRSALSILEVDMASAGVSPNLQTWQIVLDACAVAGVGDEAAALLPRIRASGIEPNVSIYERVIYATSKKGNWELALRMLEEIGKVGLRPTGRSFSAAMKACVEAQQWQLVQDLLDAMEQAEIPRGAWVFNICMDAYAKSGDWERAVDILRNVMPEAGVKPDAASWASAMHAAASGGQWMLALSLWDEMRKTEGKQATAKSNMYAYNIAIDACGKLGLVDRAMSLLEDMRAIGVAPTLITYNSAIDACARSRRWARALQLLREMRSVGIDPDVVAYTSAIAALIEVPGEKEQEIGLGLLEEMKEADVMPTNFTYSAIMTLCANSGQWEHGLALFDELKGSGQVPNSASFTAAIDNCGVGGCWETALDLIDEMEETTGAPPTVQAFNAAIRACCRGLRWDLGVSLMKRMKSVDIEPDVVSMNALVKGLREKPYPPEAKKPCDHQNATLPTDRQSCEE